MVTLTAVGEIRYNQDSMKLKTASKLLAALAIAGVIALVPARAFAITPAQLLILTDRSAKLCAAGDGYETYCAQAASYQALAKAAFEKPADEREAFIKANNGDSLNAPYLKTVEAYNKAVDAGDINPNSSGSGSTDDKEFSGDCNNGGVEVSVGISGKNECVGGDGVNPIYAYLKGIILFMGGAIGLAVVITIIVAGIQYSSSAGNPANITKAKERLMNAVIGLVLYLFLAAILRYLVPQIFV